APGVVQVLGTAHASDTLQHCAIGAVVQLQLLGRDVDAPQLAVAVVGCLAWPARSVVHNELQSNAGPPCAAMNSSTTFVGTSLQTSEPIAYSHHDSGGAIGLRFGPR